MERFRFENQGTSTYFVCSLTDRNIDTMSLGMLTNNKIPGFAPALYTQHDEEMLMKYNVSSHITLKQYFSGVVNKKHLLSIFSGIVEALNSAEEYMLDLKSVLLHMDYIFASAAGDSVKMICVPVLDMPERGCDYGTFFKQIMFSAQFDQSEDCGYVTRILNYLNGTSAFSIEEFGRLIQDLENVAGQQAEHRENPAADRQYVETMLLRGETSSERQQAPETAVLSDAGSAAFRETAVQGNLPPAEPAVSGDGIQNQALDGKDISFFYLMKHYNRENASRYKTQKETKKQAEKEEKERKKLGKKQKKQEKQEKKGKTKKKAAIQNVVAVPSNPGTPEGIAVPSNPGAPGGIVVPSSQSAQTGGMAVPPNQPLHPGLAVMPPNPPQSYGNISSGGRNENFGETTVLSSQTAGETTVLKNSGQTEPVRPYLLRIRNGEKVCLDRPIFRIGKERSFADYVVLDNTAVSRSHADFIQRDGICYVVDHNSTNHTYINDRMIPSNVETVLQDGDKICLANEEFRYKRM